MRRALEALRVDLVDVFGPGGPGREPAAFRDDFQSADGSLIAGARVSLAVIGSPANPDSLTESGVSAENFRFCSGVAGASMRV